MSTLGVSVKDTTGKWTTFVALEIRVAQPIVVQSDTAGVLTITSGAANEGPPPQDNS